MFILRVVAQRIRHKTKRLLQKERDNNTNFLSRAQAEVKSQDKENSLKENSCLLHILLHNAHLMFLSYYLEKWVPP